MLLSVSFAWHGLDEPYERHRQHFRSDVLVTFHEPLVFSPKVSVIQRHHWTSLNTYVYLQNNPELLSPVDFGNIRSLTSKLHEKISGGTLDSPSWDLIRTAKLAARMYAPLGTMMSLGDHVRIIRAFLEAFKIQKEPVPEVEHWKVEVEEITKLQTDLKVRVCTIVLKSNYNAMRFTGLSRSTGPLCHQGRPDSQAPAPPHNRLSDDHSSDLGHMPIRILTPRTAVMAPCLCDLILRRS